MVTAIVSLLGLASAVLVVGVFASVLMQLEEIDHPR